MAHLFVAHGDLVKLACDGLLIPCDSDGNVSRYWENLLPGKLPRSDINPEWLVLSSKPNDAGVIELPASSSRAVWAFVTVGMDEQATPERVAERTFPSASFRNQAPRTS